MASATAIRAVLENRTVDDFKESNLLLASQIPPAALNLARTRLPLTADDFSALLSLRFLELDCQGTPLETFLDVSPELAKRIGRQILDFFSDFQPDSKFKDQTVHLHPYQPQSFPYFIRYDRSRCCTQKDERICILCPDSWFPSGIRPIIGSNQKGIRTAFDHQDSRCL